MIMRYITIVGIGVAATAFIDVWNFALGRLFDIRSLDFCLLGRWIGHMRRGVFRHRAIKAAVAQPHECLLGWLAHYGIGITLAGGFLVWLAPNWLPRPTLLPALLYGIATAAFPLFVLQPALGLGIASAATPSPVRARLKSLATHAVYGIGLYVCARLVA